MVDKFGSDQQQLANSGGSDTSWQRAIDEGRLFGIEHLGEWFEVGDPAAIAPTEAALARG